jgi:hypothetical protein
MICTDKMRINWFIYGISHTPLPGASSQNLPFHWQTQPLRQQQIKNTLHRHHSLHLPCLLPDTYLWSTQVGRQWPLLLDESHPRIQPWDIDGARIVACCVSRVDFAVADWYWHHFFGPAQPSVGEVVRRFPKIAGDDNSFRLGVCIYVVWCIWISILNWNR